MKIFLIVLVLAVAYVNSQNGVNGQSSFPKPGSEIWNPENVQTLDPKNPNVHVGRYRDDRKCRQAGALLYQILKNILQIVPETATWYKSILGIDVRSSNAVLRLACSLFNAKTVQQIADRLPGASRDQVRVHYNNLQQYVVQRGGYKGFWKHILIRHDTGRWAKSNGFTVSNSNISQHVDLPTLTKFFKTMQVKYGNRWISGLMEANYIVRVTDVEKFAKGLYESNTPAELGRRTGLDWTICYQLVPMFGSPAVITNEMFRKMELMIVQLIQLLGPTGFFDLE